MAASDNINEHQARSNQHWSEVWASKVRGATPDSNMRPSRGEDQFYNWTKSGISERHPFPTRTLMRQDPMLAPPSKQWDPNPSVARLQQSPLQSKQENTPMSFQVDTSPTETMHATLREANAPEHVTVYHFGKPPDDSMYGSGSVAPDWPESVRGGWRSGDPSINKGPLHIFLVPHEDILATSGSENEVFFRRGTPLNKRRRSVKQQRNEEFKVENDWDAPR